MTETESETIVEPSPAASEVPDHSGPTNGVPPTQADPAPEHADPAPRRGRPRKDDPAPRANREKRPPKPYRPTPLDRAIIERVRAGKIGVEVSAYTDAFESVFGPLLVRQEFGLANDYESRSKIWRKMVSLRKRGLFGPKGEAALASSPS